MNAVKGNRLFWPVLLACLVGALVVAAWPSSGAPPTQAQRIASISAQIRCPTCQGLSVGQSDAPLAESAKQEIATEVGQGRSDKQIKAFFVSKYGDTALMSPPRKGTAAVVWIVPIVGGLVAVVALYLAVRKWGSGSKSIKPTADDRRLVERALRGSS